ncbi:polysaccharide export protein [Treponema phagedenis]|nr:polysaccharide export protein [Treponema phagedenis]
MKKRLFFVFCFLAYSICQQTILAQQTIDTQQAMSNPNYLVTPGDMYRLSYAVGTTKIDYTIAVDISYRVRISNLAIINVRGMTFSAFKNEAERIVSKNYPLSAVQLAMISPARFSVIVKGEVKTTTEVPCWALTRLSAVVTPLLTQYSSIRDVSITSVTGETKNYDIFKAANEGALTEDPYLRPGDIITIQKLQRSVVLKGAVRRPGTYQLLENENLETLINLYGKGFTDSANLAGIKINHAITTEETDANAEFADWSEQAQDVALKNRDTIIVLDKEDSHQVVYFEGAFSFKNSSLVSGDKISDSIIPVQFTRGDTLASAIRERRTWFGQYTDTAAAYLLRENKRIPIELNKILYDIEYQCPIELQAGDRLIVPILVQQVTVSGAVMRPGRYPYAPGRTWSYYIGLAGGFDTNRNTGSAVIIRDIYGKKQDKKTPIMPETEIYAKSNSFLYNFSLYAPIITVSATVVTAVIAVLTFVYKK